MNVRETKVDEIVSLGDLISATRLERGGLASGVENDMVAVLVSCRDSQMSTKSSQTPHDAVFP